MIIPLGNETENAFHFIVSTNRICGLLIDGNLHCKWPLCCGAALIEKRKSFTFDKISALDISGFALIENGEIKGDTRILYARLHRGNSHSAHFDGAI